MQRNFINIKGVESLSEQPVLTREEFPVNVMSVRDVPVQPVDMMIANGTPIQNVNTTKGTPVQPVGMTNVNGTPALLVNITGLKGTLPELAGLMCKKYSVNMIYGKGIPVNL